MRKLNIVPLLLWASSSLVKAPCFHERGDPFLLFSLSTLAKSFCKNADEKESVNFTVMFFFSTTTGEYWKSENIAAEDDISKSDKCIMYINQICFKRYV